MQYFSLLTSSLEGPALQVSFCKIIGCLIGVTLCILITLRLRLSGLLIAKKSVFKNPVPGGCGGGTVLFVSSVF